MFQSANCKVVVTSYQIVSNMIDQFTKNGTWDYVILDEVYEVVGVKIR